MSSLRVEYLSMPAATLGPENPLPMLSPRLSATAGAELDPSVPVEDAEFFGYGLDAGWMPHRGLDDYDRVRVDRKFLALVLENEFLRATILPEVGGRLWSLVHKPTGRELLFVNPVFQPANLAVRGAWVTGGVEWNPCVYGHSPFTCSSLFAAAFEDVYGGESLRIYEWDRTRRVPFQIDFSLPAASQYLLVRVRLVNPHDETVPMYWWSNITIAESPNTRVIVPAEHAYTYEYWGPVKAVAIPQHKNIDVSYPSNIPYGADYFFRIADGARPWIAALDQSGVGIVHTSTSRQMGRKLFAWGSEPGGRRWQEFLSTPEHAYFEIQAGLARTQMECLPMPPRAEWEWMEAYGLIETNAEKTHGRDWSAAVDEVSDRLECSLPQVQLEAELRKTAGHANRPPHRILHRGSGWGALENQRRQRAGESAFCSPGLVFDNESLSLDQSPWLGLLENGYLQEREPEHEPGAWMVQSEWRELLQNSLNHRYGNHWLTHLHLGVMHHAEGDTAAAEIGWQQSLRLRPSAWAYRNLAVLCWQKGDNAAALTYFESAMEKLPDHRPLAIEYLECLLAANLAAVALSVLEKMPHHIRSHSRVKTIEARASLNQGLIDRCRDIIQPDFELVDIREGESTLTQLWADLQKRQANGKSGAPIKLEREEMSDNGSLPIPAQLDFRVVPPPHFHEAGQLRGKEKRLAMKSARAR